MCVCVHAPMCMETGSVLHMSTVRDSCYVGEFPCLGKLRDSTQLFVFLGSHVWSCGLPYLQERNAVLILFLLCTD